MVRYYYPHESAFRSLLRWKSTLTSSVFEMAEFWLYLITAFVVMLCLDMGMVHLPLGVKELDIWKLLSPQLSITIFAVVFYNNQCYSRYMSLYSTCVDIDVSAKQFMSELLIHFGDVPDLKGHILQASKYSLAAIFYFYLSMEDPPELPDDKEWASEEKQSSCCFPSLAKGLRKSSKKEQESHTWKVIKEKGLLSEREQELVEDYPGTVFTLLFHWASYVVKDGVRILRAAKPEIYKPPELSGMSNRLYSMIDAMSSAALRVRSIQNMPVPFSYFHLLNLLISSTVFATGIGSLILVEQSDAPSYCVGFLPYAVVTFVLLALRQLSGELADPFGKDDLDFPIADFMRHIYDNVVALQTMTDKVGKPFSALEYSESNFWKPEEIMRPCQDNNHEPSKWSLRLSVNTDGQDNASQKNGTSSGGFSRFYRLLDEEHSGYGPRNWVKPEDLVGGRRLAKWVRGKLNDEHESDRTPPAEFAVPVEQKAEGVKAQVMGKMTPGEASGKKVTAEPKAQEATLPPAPWASQPGGLQDPNCLQTLQGIERQMEQLVTCMGELAGNFKDYPPTKSKETRTTTVKAKAKKETPGSQAAIKEDD